MGLLCRQAEIANHRHAGCDGSVTAWTNVTPPHVLQVLLFETDNACCSTCRSLTHTNVYWRTQNKHRETEREQAWQRQAGIRNSLRHQSTAFRQIESFPLYQLIFWFKQRTKLCQNSANSYKESWPDHSGTMYVFMCHFLRGGGEHR